MDTSLFSIWNIFTYNIYYELLRVTHIPLLYYVMGIIFIPLLDYYRTFCSTTNQSILNCFFKFGKTLESDKPSVTSRLNVPKRFVLIIPWKYIGNILLHCIEFNISWLQMVWSFLHILHSIWHNMFGSLGYHSNLWNTSP